MKIEKLDDLTVRDPCFERSAHALMHIYTHNCYLVAQLNHTRSLILSILFFFVGENLEKEPRIMELQNQVNKLSCVAYFILKLILNTYCKRFSSAVFTSAVQNHSDYRISCCSREAT